MARQTYRKAYNEEEFLADEDGNLPPRALAVQAAFLAANPGYHDGVVKKSRLKEFRLFEDVLTTE